MAGSAGSRTRRQRGQAAVELALLLPVLVTLLLGALDLGRAFHYYTAVANATRAGGVYALSAANLKCTTEMDAAQCLAFRTDQIKDSIRYEIEAQNIGILVGDIHLQKLDGTPVVDIVSTEYARVTVQYTFDLISPFGPAFGLWPGSLDFNYSSAIRFT